MGRGVSEGSGEESGAEARRRRATARGGGPGSSDLPLRLLRLPCADDWRDRAIVQIGDGRGAFEGPTRARERRGGTDGARKDETTELDASGRPGNAPARRRARSEARSATFSLRWKKDQTGRFDRRRALSVSTKHAARRVTRRRMRVGHFASRRALRVR